MIFDGCYFDPAFFDAAPCVQLDPPPDSDSMLTLPPPMQPIRWWGSPTPTASGAGAMHLSVVMTATGIAGNDDDDAATLLALA